MNDIIFYPCCPKCVCFGWVFVFFSLFIKELLKISARQKDACGQKDNYDGIQPAFWMQL